MGLKIKACGENSTPLGFINNYIKRELDMRLSIKPLTS